MTVSNASDPRSFPLLPHSSPLSAGFTVEPTVYSAPGRGRSSAALRRQIPAFRVFRSGDPRDCLPRGKRFQLSVEARRGYNSCNSQGTSHTGILTEGPAGCRRRHLNEQTWKWPDPDTWMRYNWTSNTRSPTIPIVRHPIFTWRAYFRTIGKLPKRGRRQRSS